MSSLGKRFWLKKTPKRIRNKKVPMILCRPSVVFGSSGFFQRRVPTSGSSGGSGRVRVPLVIAK